MYKLEEKPPALNREHPAPQKRHFFVFILFC
jgi:hypothetical protein